MSFLGYIVISTQLFFYDYSYPIIVFMNFWFSLHFFLVYFSQRFNNFVMFLSFLEAFLIQLFIFNYISAYYISIIEI